MRRLGIPIIFRFTFTKNNSSIHAFIFVLSNAVQLKNEEREKYVKRQKMPKVLNNGKSAKRKFSISGFTTETAKRFKLVYGWFTLFTFYIIKISLSHEFWFACQLPIEYIIISVYTYSNERIKPIRIHICISKDSQIFVHSLDLSTLSDETRDVYSVSTYYAN